MDLSKNNGLADLTFKSIIDALPCYLMIQDRKFNVLFANQSFQHDFGSKLAGKTCYSLLKGVNYECPDCPVRDTFEDKGFHVSEELIYLPDGTVIEMLAYSAPLFDVVGNVVASIKLLANIGSIKNIHRELVTLGQSIALLSHDIKNILEGLHGGVYVVEEGFNDKDADLSMHGWEIVKRNITEITRITQNILYSAKDGKPKLQEISPSELARQTGQLYLDKAQSMGIQLLLQINPAIPPLRMDPAGMSRMLSNLIWNALQACHNDKEKSKHFVFFRLDFYDKSHIMFEIEDNASGMDKYTKDNIFEEFYSTKGESGTGLGLMVVERIVKNHKGKIEVLSKPGRGSLFRVIMALDPQKHFFSDQNAISSI